MEFARWVFETAPSQVILRVDAQQLPVDGESIEAGMIGHFSDDDGWDFGHFRIRLGVEGKPDRVSYFSWRRDFYHGVWQERGVTSQWPRDWKQPKPVICRRRTVALGAAKRREQLPHWETLHPHSRTTLQYVQLIRGIVRSLAIGYSGSIDPFVLLGTDKRLAALITQGNREFHRLAA
jgi:hypothetical protein